MKKVLLSAFALALLSSYSLTAHSFARAYLKLLFPGAETFVTPA